MNWELVIASLTREANRLAETAQYEYAGSPQEREGMVVAMRVIYALAQSFSAGLPPPPNSPQVDSSGKWS